MTKAKAKANAERTDLREVEWPPPREDPPKEPSHPGAKHEDPNEHGPDKKIDPKS